ncbi:MAG: bifunctional diaminohydroxyphosphoribosylaminopyrimidine deaminase/5-amino-6-(5-phosphoribosylamino)uracil reductase RibD [Acidobacteria bacterium]|nr:bifunctional diaminohydroxyphosphoribosylaminopyrimidine deaminase/5-amino-6-(5-phosphoribosylamino)uracil reductase RibD [Acidobacteriota bacterium]
MASRIEDEVFMRQALDLAREGTALTSPNPMVGALVVHEAAIVGRGYHLFEGVKHAEVLALDQAGEQVRGATLYLNLEPCCHEGRTGPCVERVIASGIKRVVVAMPDPNPQVNGKSLERMRKAGIEVTEGVGRAEARKLNEAFARYIRSAKPLVTLKAGMTLDGKIAPPPGESENPSALGAGGATGGWITSEQARAHVQELRHAMDAIMVGVGTIIADDPLLTDRTGRPRRRPLLRVIMDSRLRLSLDSRVAKTAKNDVVVFCSFAEEKRKREFEGRGLRVEQVKLGTPDGRPDLPKIVERLGEMEITSLLIEGGALLNWTALATGAVDKVFLYYAPKILAGTGSVPFAAGPGFRRMSEAAQVKTLAVHRFGEDFAVEGYLRDPYEGM